MRVIDHAFTGIGPVERDAPAFGGVERGQVVDDPAGEGAEEERRTLARQDFSGDFGLEIFARQPHPVRAGIPHQLAQDGVRIAVLRIGQRARAAKAADFAAVFRFLEVAPGVGQHRRDIAEDAGKRRGLGELLIGARIGGTDKSAEPAAGFDEIDRVAGGEADRAGQPVAAVKCGSRTAQDLDRFDEAYIGVPAAPRILRAEGKALGAADAIDLDEHAVPANAADDEVFVPGTPGRAERGTEAGRGAAHRNAGFVAHEVLDVGGQFVGDLLVVDHGYRRRGVRNLQRNAGRRDNDLFVIFRGRLIRRQRRCGRAGSGQCGEGRSRFPASAAVPDGRAENARGRFECRSHHIPCGVRWYAAS